jgi:hypothetical protein
MRVAEKQFQPIPRVMSSSTRSWGYRTLPSWRLALSLSSSRPSTASCATGALLRSFGHVRLVAIAGALVVHCQEKTSLTLQSQAMGPSWSGAWSNAKSTNSASTTSITTLRCWFYAVPSSRLMLLCKNRWRRRGDDQSRAYRLARIQPRSFAPSLPV